jgi:GAF domain-containing protein
MEPHSTLDHTSPGTGGNVSVGAKSVELYPEQAVQQNSSNRASQASVSAALASAHAEGSSVTAGVRFPGEDGGRSLAEMAQRDLDAALQLLADRAQYITGASGAAIALRRNGKNDMLCRASTGSNAPELGALLSTEFGLSGESVRTRQPLRCDDAERDARVNREVCRHLGIASVVVMPVVNDDEVLGVFELFSGKANAFGARDVSAVQRLSEMVETAVRLARATEKLPQRLKMADLSAGVQEVAVVEDQVLDGQMVEDLVLGEDEPVLEIAVEALTKKENDSAKADAAENRDAVLPESLTAKVPAASASSGQPLSQKAREDGAPVVGNRAAVPEAVPPVAPPEPAPKKKLFWSAALTPAADAGKTEEPDQSHVPPVLRSLRKCEACGFPVSAGRALCVECEEKKWRGQLKAGQVPRQNTVPAPPNSARPGVGTSGAKALPQNQGSSAALEAPRQPKAAPSASRRAPGAVPAAGAVSARAASVASPTPKPAEPKLAAGASMQSAQASAAAAAPGGVGDAMAVVQGKESTAGTGQSIAPGAVDLETVPEAASTTTTQSPEFVLSAGLEPSQSWISENKYIVGVLLVVAAVVAVVFFLR